MNDEIEELREELAEANARRDDMRTALEWANKERDAAHAREIACATEALAMQRERDSLKAAWEQEKLRSDELREERDRLREQLAAEHSECPDCADYAARSGRFAEQADRLQRERDESIKARDQYLRERDQARLAEERARESLDELDEAIYECLPSDDDDAPLDCVERAADQLRALRQERDEARAEVERMKERMVDHAAKFEAGTKAFRNMAAEAVVDARDAYRRGAEAMREKVMDWLVQAQAEATVVVVDTAIRGVHKLPIPGEP